MYRIAAIVVARNEEATLAKTLMSLKGQSLKPFIITVDDGSMDSTAEIAKIYSDYVICLPCHEESWAGKPELARVFNAGFQIAKEIDSEYIMISGADSVYPEIYLEKIIKYMKKEETTVIASGIPEGEKAKFPRGSGRVIDVDWFREIGFKYPENWGFEAYVIFKALQMKRNVRVYPVTYKLLRKTSMTPKKAYYWGKAMKALGYWTPYALGRSMLWFFKSPKITFSMIKGYCSRNVKKYNDIENFVKSYQKKMILNFMFKLSSKVQLH